VRAWPAAGALAGAVALASTLARTPPALAAQEIRCLPESAELSARDLAASRSAVEGRAAFERGEYLVAGRLFQDAMDASSSFEPGLVQFWFARSLLGIGKTREAAFALYRALREEEARPERDAELLGAVRLWLGKSYDLLGRRGRAVEWYRAVVDSGGRTADVEEARRHIAEPFADEPAPQPPEVRELKALLRRLFLAEEHHWRSYGRYSDRLSELGVDPPPAVRVQVLLLGGGAGFLAEGRTADGRYSCRVFSGRGTRPGHRGIVFCP
jgi:tetratricopeptide (TPR) repeat protein